MKKIYNFNNSIIRVEFEPGIVRVYSDAGLWKFMETDYQARLQVLVTIIKKDYQNEYFKTLAISDQSLIVEILAHVYCDYIGLQFNLFVKFKPLNILVNKLLKRAAIVDCGERHKDSNRWLWDLLSGQTDLLIKLLPKRLNYQKLKS